MTRDQHVRYASAQKLDRLARWTSRKPLIALMGEFSAGKSTLLNLLIGESILPTQVTATQMPPVWLRYGTDEPFRLDSAGERHPVDLDDLTSLPLKDTRFVRIYSESGYLKECDLLDTPGISDPKIPMRSWVKTIGYANAVLWCTHAAQAWRESERSAWESLPERLREHSLMVVTRADKLESDDDRKKIDRRLQREAGELFSGRHFISLTKALEARADGDGDETQAWKDCGAKPLMDALKQVVENINLERSNLLWRYQLSDEADAVPAKALVANLFAVDEPPTAVPDELEENALAEPAGAGELETQENQSDNLTEDQKQVQPARVRLASSSDRPRLSGDTAEALRAGLVNDPPADEAETNGSATLSTTESSGVFKDLRAALGADTEQTEPETGDIDAAQFSVDIESVDAPDQAAATDDLQTKEIAQLDPPVALLPESALQDGSEEPGTVAEDHTDARQKVSNIAQLNPDQGHQFDEEYDEPSPTLADVEHFNAKIAAARLHREETLAANSQSTSNDALEASVVRSIWNDIQDNHNIKALPNLQDAFQNLLARLEDPVTVPFETSLDRARLGGDG